MRQALFAVLVPIALMACGERSTATKSKVSASAEDQHTAAKDAAIAVAPSDASPKRPSTPLGRELTAGEKQCKPDQTYLSFCSQADAAGKCGPTGKSMQNYPPDHIPVPLAAGDEIATFKLDPDVPPESDAPCCYSKCGTLRVADYGRPPEGRMAGSTCFPIPPAGTTKPHKDEPRCPKAIFSGIAMPFGNIQNGLCCYRDGRKRPPDYYHPRREPKKDPWSEKPWSR